MPQVCQGRVVVPYEVELVRAPRAGSNGGRARMVARVDTGTPGLACMLALRMYPGFRVLRVSRTWVPITQCNICGVLIFEGDGHRKRSGGMRCWECA